MMNKTPRKVVIVGSGVIGLSIALQLKSQGNYQITIIASDLPSDSHSREFASPWAGANWASTSSDPNQQQWCEATFKQWQRWAQELPPEMIAEMPFSLYIDRAGFSQKVADWHASFLPDFRIESNGENELVSKFTGITLSVPAYLQLLEEQSRAKESRLFPGPCTSQQLPVHFIRTSLEKLSQCFNHVPDAELIINATGLGARTLKDVCDKSVYPIRGQTVLIQASSRMLESPRCAMSGPKTGNFNVRNSAKEDQEFDYVIPRAKSGNIICGGCAIPEEYNTEVDEGLGERILRRCVKLVPELLEDSTDISSDHAWRTLKVLQRGVGLRPARESGMRLEFEKIPLNDKYFHVLHSYGAGGGGYQSAYGVAVNASELIDEFFKKR